MTKRYNPVVVVITLILLATMIASYTGYYEYIAAGDIQYAGQVLTIGIVACYGLCVMMTLNAYIYVTSIVNSTIRDIEKMKNMI